MLKLSLFLSCLERAAALDYCECACVCASNAPPPRRTALWPYIIPNAAAAAAVIGAVMRLLSKCNFLGLNQNGQDCFLAGWLAGWLVGWAWVPLLPLCANMTHTHTQRRKSCFTAAAAEESHFYWCPCVYVICSRQISFVHLTCSVICHNGSSVR